MSSNPSKLDSVAQSFDTTGTGVDTNGIIYMFPTGNLPIAGTPSGTGNNTLCHVHLFVTANTTAASPANLVAWQSLFAVTSIGPFNCLILPPTTVSGSQPVAGLITWMPTIQIVGLKAADAPLSSGVGGFKVIINDNGLATRWGIFARVALNAVINY